MKTLHQTFDDTVQNVEQTNMKTRMNKNKVDQIELQNDDHRQRLKYTDHVQEDMDELNANTMADRVRDLNHLDSSIQALRGKAEARSSKEKLGIGCVKLLYDSTSKSTDGKSSRFRPKFMRKNPVTTLFLKFRWITSTEGSEIQHHCQCCPKRYQNQ